MANEEVVAQIAAMGWTGILLLVALLIALVLPVFLVLFSKRVHGGRKLLWVVLMGTFSWLAWPLYLIMLRKSGAPPEQPPAGP